MKRLYVAVKDTKEKNTTVFSLPDDGVGSTSIGNAAVEQVIETAAQGRNL